MIQAIIGGFGCVVLAALAELLHRKQRIRGEHLRKFLHIGLGVYIATWPWFIARFWIIVLMLGAMMVIMAIFYLPILRKLLRFIDGSRELQRISYGELFYVEGIALAALLFREPAIFSAAVCVMAVADGLAALIGQKFGARNQYSVRGVRKSIAGSATFFVVTCAVLIIALWEQGTIMQGSVLTQTILVTGLAYLLTCTEAVSARGLDNILLPVVVGFGLQFATSVF